MKLEERSGSRVENVLRSSRFVVGPRLARVHCTWPGSSGGREKRRRGCDVVALRRGGVEGRGDAGSWMPAAFVMTWAWLASSFSPSPFFREKKKVQLLYASLPPLTPIPPLLSLTTCAISGRESWHRSFRCLYSSTVKQILPSKNNTLSNLLKKKKKKIYSKSGSLRIFVPQTLYPKPSFPCLRSIPPQNQIQNSFFFQILSKYPKITRILRPFFSDAFSHANASRVAGEEEERERKRRYLGRFSSPRESGSLLREENREREREREILHGLIDSGVPWPVVLMRCDSRTWKSCRQLAGLFLPPPYSRSQLPLDSIPYAHTCHATVHWLLKRSLILEI